MAIVTGLCWMNFCSQKLKRKRIGNIWFQQGSATCHTAKATLDVLRPVFEDRIISCRAVVVRPPWSCDLTPLDYYLWGAVKNKCYADKPETIDALKDNIREDIGEIQLHTIMCLKIGPPRQPFEWNYFPLLTGSVVLSNKNISLRKYSVDFFKNIFQKKRYLAEPL